MKTLIATATKLNEQEFKNSRLANSLKNHKSKQTNVSYTLQPTYNNTSPLCATYNKYLTKEYVKIYVDLKRKEYESFNLEISNIELKWYLNL